MPRTRTKERYIEIRCCMCPVVFKAARSDKRTCGIACRKRLSRALADPHFAKSAKAKLSSVTEVKCYACGCQRPTHVVRCPICGEEKTKKGKR